MNKFFVCISLGFLLLASGWANASQSKTVSVSIPRSSISLDPETERYAPVRSSAQYQFALSSWEPSAFRGFHKGTVPHLSVNLLSPVLSLSRNLFWKFGVGFLYSTRQQRLEIAGERFELQQNAYLLPFRAGMEYRPFTFSKVRPFASLALLPTFAIIPRSAVSPGDVGAGVPLEAALGVSREWPNFGASVSWIRTAGTVYGSSFAGNGLEAAIRAQF